MQLGSDYIQGYSSLATQKPLDKNQSVEALAKQFESQLFSLLLKSARAAANNLGGDFLSSNEMKFRQESFDQMLAEKSSGGPLYQHFVTALNRQFGVDKPAIASMTPPVVQPIDADKEDSADIVQDIYEQAKQFADKIGVSAKLLWAQAMLETGWGKHFASEQSHNLFGIKAKGNDKADFAKTTEVIAGTAVRIVQPFKRYTSYAESFKDYVELIQSSPRYRDAISQTSDEGYIKALQSAGYATDPDYADKVLNVMNSSRARELLE